MLKLTDAEKDEKRSLEEVEMERLDHQQRKPKASTSSKVVRKLGMEQNIIYLVIIMSPRGVVFGLLYLLVLRCLLRKATQAWKQTSGDPSGQTWRYRDVTLL